MKNKKGFTLIELLVVVAIISILLVYVVSSAISATGRGKVVKAKSQIKLLENALDKYRSDFRKYPPDTGYGFDVTLSKTDGGKTADYDPGSLWRYLYLPREVNGRNYPSYLTEWPNDQIKVYDDPDTPGEDCYLTDPWGNPYAFTGKRKRILNNAGGVDVFSAGPDGVTGCNDSIKQEDGPEVCNPNPFKSVFGGDNCMYNGIDDDQNGVVDDIGEIGPEAKHNGNVDDDINNWEHR